MTSHDPLSLSLLIFICKIKDLQGKTYVEVGKVEVSRRVVVFHGEAGPQR